MGSIFFFLSWRLTSSLSLIQKGTISITTFIVFFLLWSPTSVSFLHLFSSPLIVTIIITCNSIFATPSQLLPLFFFITTIRCVSCPVCVCCYPFPRSSPSSPSSRQHHQLLITLLCCCQSCSIDVTAVIVIVVAIASASPVLHQQRCEQPLQARKFSLFFPYRIILLLRA